MRTRRRLKLLRSSADTANVLTLVAIVAAGPVFVLVHELGHGLWGLWATEGLVRVRVGREPARWRFRIGRLAFELNPVVPQSGRGGDARTFAHMSRGDIVVYALAGPAANLAVSAVLVLALIAHVGPTETLAWLAGMSTVLGLYNLVPRRYHGHPSDGRIALDALRRRSEPVRDRAWDETFARWIAAGSNERHPARTPERGANLSVAARGLGLAPESPACTAATQLAALGWFWRASEDSEPDALLTDLSKAGTRAIEQRAPAGRLPAAIAWEFLAAGGDPGVASPGGTTFLERAFDSVYNTYRQHLERSPALHAFKFGVAMHDAEQIVA